MIGPRMAVVDDDVAVSELLEASSPLELDTRFGDLVFDFPNNLLIGRDFDDRIA